MMLSISRLAKTTVIAALAGSTSVIRADPPRIEPAFNSLTQGASVTLVDQPVAGAVTLLSASQLETALGPIALYPDPLLAQIFAASIYPLDVIRAARWVQTHPDLAGIDDQDWDPSVKAVARFKNVIAMMDANLDWTVQLGQAFTCQRQDVMDAVQRLRARAVAATSLATNAQQTVIVEREVVRIVPAQPEVIYVPVYDPQVVYVPATQVVYVDRPCYRPARWCAPVWSEPCVATGPFVSFSIGFSLGGWCDLDFDWRDRLVCYHDWRHDDHRGGRWHDGRRDDDRRDRHDDDRHDGGGRRGGDHHDRFSELAIDNSRTVNVDRSTHVTNVNVGDSREGRVWKPDVQRQSAQRTGSFAGTGPGTSTAGGPARLAAAPGNDRITLDAIERPRSITPTPERRIEALKPAPTTRVAKPAAPAVVADTPTRVMSPRADSDAGRKGSFALPGTPAPKPIPSMKPAPVAAPTVVRASAPRAAESPAPAVRQGSFNAGNTSAVVVSKPAPAAAAPTPAPKSAPAARSEAPARQAQRAAPAPRAASAPVMGPVKAAPAPAPAQRTGSFGGVQDSGKKDAKK